MSSEADVMEAVGEILRARDALRESRFLDLINISDEIRKLKEEIHFMRYKPWEWFTRDQQFQRALLNEIDKRVAREVEQGLMFVLYNERPDKVVEMVKRVVEDYLKKWEIDDQIARQIVANVVNEPQFIENLLKILIPNVIRAVVNAMKKMREEHVDEMLKLLEEYDVLEKESGD